MAKAEQYDLIVIGAGPAGMAAAINGESEGINTLVLDAAELGGQARTSTLIENIPGFPEGITGAELTQRTVAQALRFDTEFVAPYRVERVESAGDRIAVYDGVDTLLGRAVLLSTGVQLRRLPASNVAAYLGRGASYGSPNPRIDQTDRRLFVVGGANSAGQAAVHLASKFQGTSVHLIVRGESIDTGMSQYLADKVRAQGNITVRTETEVAAVDGDGVLRSVTLKDASGKVTLEADELFIMIGAVPSTGWLPPEVAKDKLGYVLAGGDLPDESRARFVDSCGRQPFAHETGMPGLFVAGDVRSGTIKRVATASGDGAGVIPELHRYCER